MQLRFDADETLILDALLENAVRFVVIGGAAVQHYVINRNRDDLDILLEPTLDNADRFIAAVQDYHPPFSDEHRSRIAQREPPLQIRLDARFNIDILTAIAGVATEDAVKEAVFVCCGVQVVPLLSKAHLIASKSARGEEKDLNDLAALELCPPP